jgi:xyloglucan-specific exo-beta-1,4-glucanase
MLHHRQMLRPLGRWFVAIGLAAAAGLVTAAGNVPARAAAASMPSDPATWNHVPIGGGGYVTGMVAHPAVKDLVYIRTDVGGAYRWNPVDQSWTSITDWIPADDRDLYRIESLAVAPTDPGTVYLAGGSGWAGNSSIMKSTDQGKTWTVTRLGIVIDGNAGGGDNPARSSGERLAVDPGTANTVYFGSRNDGLWHSADAGATWSRDTRFPVTGTAGRGVAFTLFARTNEAAGAPTRTVYAAVYDSGIYRSTDAGATWALMPGSPTEPNRAALASNGDLYVTHKTGVAKFSGGTWTNVTPPSAAQYNAVNVDPANPAHVITITAHGDGECPSCFNNPIFQSTDGGGSWTQVSYIRNNTVPWWPSFYWSASTASVTFDPFHPGRVWYTDWYGTWRTDDIAASPSTWTNYEKGHEESVVVSNIASPPSGNVLLHSGVADNGGYDHTSLTAFPATSQRDHGLPGTTTGLDFSEANPDFLVRVGRDGNNGNTSRSGYSTDGGANYTQFPSQPEAAGRVAVSATSTATSSRIVWAAQGTGSGQVRYSTDRGSTWTVSAGAPSGMITTDANWDGCQPLTSDRVDGNKFYIYHAGKFYRSTNGGASFADTGATGLPDNTGNNGGCEYFEAVKVAAAPGVNGEVWISFGWNGLYRSTDSGSTFTKVAAVSDARVFGFGKGLGAPSSATPPALYLHGIVNGVDGVFRSVDLGNSWTQINGTQQIGCRLKDMTGDRQVFGRVYIATDGCGIYYGQSATAPPVTPHANAVGTNDIAVDGAVSEAAWQQGGADLPYSMSKAVLGTWNNTVRYSTAWNNTYLYVAARVSDAALYNNSATVWNNDAVEVYIDGNHNRGTSYDSNDNQYIVGSDNTLFAKNGQTSGVLHATRLISGGYEIELAIPWANLNITPATGTVIGFDIGNDDNDHGTGRDGQAVAFGTADDWTDTSAFGDLTLVGTPPAPTDFSLVGTGSGKCADVPGGSQTDGTGLIIYTCHGSSNQRWTQTAGNELRIYSGTKCMDAGTSQPGTRVAINACTGSNSQKWAFNGNGTIANAQSGICLDVNGAGTADNTPIIVWNCNGGSNQRWTRQP